MARELGVARTTVESHFALLLGIRLPVFARRAQWEPTTPPRFFCFEPPLDDASEFNSAALETLVLQHLRDRNEQVGLGYEPSSWRTRQGDELDFVLHGERGLSNGLQACVSR